MLCLVLLAIFSIPLIHGQETGQQDNKAQCINELVGWCNRMQYSQNGDGMSMISVNYRDSTDYYRVLCISDSEGTNCTRNGSPWFSCAPDRTLTYKGQVLTDTSTNVDNDICNTTYAAFNRLFIQNMSHNTSALDKEFFDEMIDDLRTQMAELRKRLSSIGSDIWNGFADDSFMFPEHDSRGLDDIDNISTEDSNQVERE